MEYIIITDLEATCDMGPQRRVTKHTSEIIEFPFIIFCLTTGKVMQSEQHYIRPTNMDDITEFCTQLTGITQNTVESKGETLQAVVSHLEDIYEKRLKSSSNNGRAVFCCDGRWDVHFMLQLEIRRKGISLRFPELWGCYYDLKVEFMRMFPVDKYPEAAYHPAPSLRHMARFVKSKIVGNHHCGIDDCESILQILLKMRTLGHAFGDPVVVEKDYDPLRDDLIKDFNESFSADSLTWDKVYEVFEFPPNDVLAIVEANFVPVRDEGSIRNFFLIVKDSYQAQVFLSRGNISAFVYSRAHFLHRCASNAAMCLAVCWRPWWKDNATLRQQCRTLLNLPMLGRSASDTSYYYVREIKRFLQLKIYDQCALKMRSALFECQAAAVLANNWQRDEIEEHEFALDDDEAFVADNEGWSWLDSDSWEAQYGSLLNSRLASLRALCESQFLDHQAKAGKSLGSLVAGLHAGTVCTTPLGVQWDGCFLSARSSPRIAAGHLSGFEAFVLNPLDGNNPLCCIAPLEHGGALEEKHEHRHQLHVTELLRDGVWCTLYMNARGEWSVATAYTVDGSEDTQFPCEFNNAMQNVPMRPFSGLAVETVFWSIWHKENYTLPAPRGDRVCYCWFLKLASSELQFHSCWALPALTWIPIQVDAWNWKAVRSFARCSSLADAQQLPEFLYSCPMQFSGVELLDIGSGGRWRKRLETESWKALQLAVRLQSSKTPRQEASVLQSLMRLALWVEHNSDAEWLSRRYPLLTDRFQKCNAWLKSTTAQMQKEMDSAQGKAEGGEVVSKRGLAKALQSSKWKVWLLKMHDARMKSPLLFLRAHVSEVELCSAMGK